MKQYEGATPGPWAVARIVPRDGRLVADIVGSSLNVAEVHSAFSLRKELEANAKLIASAPDLLAENTRLASINEELVKLVDALTAVEKSLSASGDALIWQNVRDQHTRAKKLLGLS